MNRLPCISLWAPWGTYLADGLKAVETRHWATKFRGRLAIHQAKTTKAIAQCHDHLWAAGRMDLVPKYTLRYRDWPLGCIVAVAEMVDCVPVESVLDRLSEQERALGNYSAGRFAWLFANVRKLDPPLIAKGQQGFWTLPKDVTAAVLKLLGEAA